MALIERSPIEASIEWNLELFRVNGKLIFHVANVISMMDKEMMN